MSTRDYRIIVVGDFFPCESNVSNFIEGDIDVLFGEQICRLFNEADYRICNLEGALTNEKERCDKTGPIKVAPPDSIATYKRLGIDCALLANNHITDAGHLGVLDTVEALNSVGIDYIGAGKTRESVVRSKIKEFGELRIGFYNVSETMYNKLGLDQAGVWLYDEYVVCQEIKELKRECDYVIVLYHGGIEKFPYPSPELKKRFHRMADNGANVVIAQHSHCIGSEEYYNGSYLLYGQGDFMMKNFSPGLTDTGLIIEVDCSKNQISIKKHLVRSKDKKYVRYDEQQDLSSFEERSRKIADEEYVWKQFQALCDKELRFYLTAFRSPSKIRLQQYRFFPDSYKKWLFNYKKRDLLFTLHTLRSEQNRETAIVGLEHMLDLMRNKED